MIAAGVVLFNPEINRLERNIEAFISYVDKIYCYDNCSDNIKQIISVLGQYKKIELIRSNENKGIAYALNRIMEYAQMEGYQWVLTMDQDSVCGHDMVNELASYVDTENAGIICPFIVERNGTRNIDSNGEKYEHRDFCITSGALTRVEAWNKVGGFDEWMFIDIVDFEICAKMREVGYEILQVNNANLLQEVGQLKEIIIGKRHIYVRNHSALRKYYYARNLIYCNYCHPDTFPFIHMLNLLATTYIKTLLFEKEKFDKLCKMNRGIKDGRRKIKELKEERRNI